MAFDPTSAFLDDDTQPAAKGAFDPSTAAFDASTATEDFEADQGVLGTLKEGTKSAARAIGSTANTYTGNADGVVEKAKAQQEAPKDYRLDNFYRDVEENTKASGEDPGLLDAIGNVGKAVWDSPAGAGLAVLEQLPNSVPTLAGGFAGMKAGAALGTMAGGPVGAGIGGVVGGLAGMFLGNVAIETGHKAMAAADDGQYTPEAMSQVKREGAIKGGVITGVDAVTLGIGGAVSGAMQRTTRSALEAATRKALVDQGVDVADEAAVLAARSNPQVSAAVRAAQESAVKATDTLKRRAAEAGTLLAMESAGEGLGEYLGELAATGEGNVTDAVLESLLSVGQSGAETAWNMTRKREQRGLWEEAAAIADPSLEQPAAAPVPGADPALDGSAPIDAAAPEAAPAVDTSMVQPTPTAENPAPVPVPRPDPNNGPLSAAASLLPPAGAPALSAGPLSDVAPATERAAEPVAEQQAPARTEGPLAEAPPADPQASIEPPATPSQRAILARRGVPAEQIEGLTRKQAGELIQQQNKTQTAGAPKPQQMPLQEPEAVEAELRDQLSYLERQAKSAGGWTPALSRERARLRTALEPFDQNPSAAPAAVDAPADAFKVGEQWQKGRTSYTIESVSPDGRLADAVFPGGKRHKVSLDAELANGWQRSGQQAGAAVEQATEPAVEADPIQGQDIDGDWMTFAEQSGTKQVPRAQMPQIKAEHRGAMVNFLNARGIEHQEETVAAASLKPTQGEFSRKKVEQAKAYTGGNRSILVSSDNHVLDGHHQWLAARESGDEVKIIRLGAPIDQLLTAAHEFPSSTTERTPTTQTATTDEFSAPSETRLLTAKSPDPAPGFVRLYRGEHKNHDRDVFVTDDEPDGKVGGWFTRDKDYADYYKSTQEQGRRGPEREGRIVYVDVPESQLSRYQVRGTELGKKAIRGEENAYFIPSLRREDVIEPVLDDPATNMQAAAGEPAATAGSAQPAPAPSTAPVKWFASKSKAQAHIAKKKLGGTHQVVKNGNKYEIQPLAEQQGDLIVQQAPVVEPTPAAEPVAEQVEGSAKAPEPSVEAAEQDTDIQKPAVPSDAELELASRHKKIDKTLDLMDDAQITDLYARANLAGAATPVEQKRKILSQEHPDDIEPLLKPKAEPAAKAPEPEAAPESTSIAVRSIRAGKQLALALEAIGFTKIEGTNGMKHVVEGAGRAATTSVRVIRTDDQIQFQVSSVTTSMQDGRAKAAAPGMTETFDSMDEAVALAGQWKEVNSKWVRDAVAPSGSTQTTGTGVPIEDARKNDKLRQVRKMGREAYDAGEERTPPAWMGEGDLADAWLEGFGDGIAANVQRNMDARKEQEKAAAPDLAQQLAGMSNAALSSLIDDIAAEDAQVADTAKPAPKRKRKTQPKAKDATPKPRSTTSPAESADETDAADVERTAGEIAKSFGYNVSSAGMEAIKGLTELFGGSGRLSSGLTFDEETYAKAKPHFQAMLRDAQAAGHDLAQFVRTVLQSFGTGVKPYIIRYANDLRDEVAQPQENDNERTAVRGDGPQALDNVAAEEGGEAESGRGAGASATDGGQAGERGSAVADAAGVPAARSGGSSAGAVRSPKTGGRRKSRAVGAAGGSDAASAASPDDGRVEVNGEPTGAPNIPATNYQINDDTRLGKGGEVQKFNDNLAAIRALKQIEADNRRATPEEQAVLARYVGWGGLANAFPDPSSGKFKDKWQARGEELRDLLTPEEYKAARRSTRNAHYTSETVVSAMWQAVEKLGFKGGLVLESSMGTGNFVGLAPQNIPARFVGVEYDSLTARIASSLYPQATVLHSGFQKVPLADNAFALNIGNPPFGNESLRFQFKPELQGVSIHNQFFRAGMDALRPGGIQAMVVSRYLMDAQDKSTRLALAKQARLVGLIRLPDTAFKENARTEVVTDIVILQKLTPAEQAEMQDAVSAYYEKPKKGADDAERQARAAKIPAWVETASIPDPLGGEAMTVNAHFRDNPRDVLGTLERSGSMQHGADITVRLDNAGDLQGLLQAAIDRLPSNIQNLDAEVLEATEARFKSMSDALRIAVANEEVGHVSIDRDGKLQRVIERETPEGGIEYARQEINADSPWSEQLSQDAHGRWYRMQEVTGEDGKPVKIVKNGKATRYNVYERAVFATEADVPSSLRLGKTGFARLSGLVKLRDMLKRQLVLETSDAAKGPMEGNRKALAAAYEAFVKEHGPVNRPVNLRLAMTMPDGGLVAALEVAYQPVRTAAQAEKSGLEPQEEVATPAPILRERVVPKYEPATRAESPSDALAINLAETGRVDMGRIAQLLSITPEEAAEALQQGAEPLVFQDPETQQWETADAYLSGMVKRKLQAAKAAGMQRNVTALEKVIPEDWTAENVAVQLGATWVPPQVYADFLEHLTGGQAKASFSALTNSYSISVQGKTEAAEQWSAEQAPVEYLLGRLLNSQPVVVTYVDHEGKTHIDREKTALAGLKAREITAEFGDWVFKDGDRRNQLVELFNEQFNTRVVRQFNGQHLKLPGKVPDSILRMRRHQLNAIWRGIYERFMLVDHAVGAGKTFTAIARAMERRRMGLSRKPMIVVPNHLVEQWQADVYRLYPGAKVLAAGKKDFEAKRRRRLFGKIATGDWDIVIVPHSSFGFIGISPETESRYLEKEMREAQAAIEDAWEQAEEEGATGRRKPFGVKEAERLAEKIQNRMDALSAGVRDRLLTFEQLGIDDLTVDEAHEFKNLNYSSRLTGVRGMGDKSGSRKANDLYNKVRVLRESPSATVTFLTGTPISNSAVEMFTMLRYLAADALEEMGMTHFDAFRAQFVEATAAFEPTESGRLKEVTRLGRTWSNMRSLMDLYYQVTDAVSLDDIKRWYAEDNGGKPFPVPKVKGGKDRELIAIKPTPAQETELADVMAGFDGLDGIQDPNERNAERLRLMDRARKLSLDIRAVNPRADSTEPNGKLQVVSENIKRIYDQWHAERGTQLVFLDRSVPKSKGDDKVLKEYDELIARRDAALRDNDTEAFEEIVEELDAYDSNEMAELRAAQSSPWNAYQQIKDNLVAMGIPANEIRFVQEANNDEQKAALFDSVKGGKVRVLIGSTPRMGAGTNVQDRAVALHHVDVTWKPSDIEQREGRVIRQGNLFATPSSPLFREGFEVEILAYATERTVDAKMWDLNATKLRTINGIRKYDGAFSMEFEDEEAVGMAEMAALASGNPLLLERVKLESEINNLELQERSHRRKMYGIQDQLAGARRAIERNPALIEQARERTAKARERVVEVGQRAEQRTVTVEGKVYSTLREALQAAEDAIKLQQGDKETARWAITIDGNRVTNKDGLNEAVGAALGDNSAFEATIDGKTLYQRTVASRRAAEALNRAGDSAEPIELGDLFGYQLVADIDVKTILGSTYKNLRLSLMDGGQTVASSDAAEMGVDDKFVTQNLRGPLDRLVESVNSLASSDEAGRLERQLANAKRDLPSLEQRVGEGFPKADELAAKRKRLKDVVGELESAAPAAAAETEVEQDPDDSGVRFSRAAGGRPTGATRVRFLDRRTVEQLAVEAVGESTARTRFVFTSYADLPEDVKAEAARQGASPRSVQGLYSPKHNKTFIIDDRFTSADEAKGIMFHEHYVHFGLRAKYGLQLGPQLRQLLNGVGGLDGIRKLSREQGINLAAYERGILGNPEIAASKQPLILMEELLAHIGETTGTLRRLLEEFVGMLRAWARKSNSKWFAELGVTDMAYVLREARNAAKRADAAPTGQPLFKLVNGVEQTATDAFRSWFGDSKVVDKQGEPQVLYHGTASEFTVFENRAGNSTGHATSDLGYFMTSDQRSAEGYARNASDGMPGLAKVMELYASIKNPYVATLEEMQAIENPLQARRWRAKLEQAGHDGMHIPAAKAWVAFNNYQIKSATDNVGTFDEFDADIRFRLGDFIGRRESFDVAASNAKRTLKGRVSDLKPAMLGALPLNYLRDFAPQSMTALTAYMDEKRAMDADRNEMHTRYDAIAQRWLKLRWTDRKAEQRLADLMHAATLEGVDPSKPIKEVYTPEQKATYNRLRIQFQSLPAEHRAMFGEARDAYKQQISTLESVIEENIRKSAEYAKKRARRDRDADIQRAKDELVGDELDEALEAAEKRYNGRVASAEKGGSAKILLLRQKFESMRVDEPYFPLKRYGDYFVAMRDGDELVSFSMFESAADMEAAAAELRKTYPNLSVKVGRQSNKQELEGAVDPAFIADLQDVVSRMPNSKELSDQIYQMYLETMPDFSMRKGFIHRKKTAGFDRDAMRAFASSMFHSSYQIARLKHSLEMNELVEQVEDQAKAAKDPVDAMTIANELRKRHEWVMSPKSGKIAQHITSAAFVYQLGITPAAALVNTTQTWMMGIPILGARFGSETKAAAALTKASADFVQGRGHIEKRLEGQEAAAFAEFMRMGLIDKTQAHDLAGVGETGVEYNPVRHKVMGYISWAFHNAERYNREVTVMAAYRLGRANGLDHEAAIKEAAELTWTTHFDYSSGNRARFMQNDTAKVLLVFRQHSINMLSRLVIDLRGAMKGETPEVKRMAKRRLAGMFSMFGLFAGVMGIPGVMAILALLDLFDDDDDPWSTEDKMKRNLVDALGPDVAAVVLGGLPGTVSDLSLTERVGMGYLWFRPAGRELEGKDAYLYWMEQVLGAAPAMVSNTFTGMKMIGEGHVWRGIEAMMPKAIKDAMRAGRYTQEGVLTMDGTPLVDEVSTWNVIAQAMGFTPAHIAERYDTNRALKNAEQHILTERRSILNRYAMAVKQGDTEMRGKLLERVQAFNKRYPQYPITGRTISQSLKARAQRQAGAEGGIVLNRRLEFLREQL